MATVYVQFTSLRLDLVTTQSTSQSTSQSTDRSSKKLGSCCSVISAAELVNIMKEKPINTKQPIATNPVDEGSSSQFVSSVYAAKP